MKTQGNHRVKGAIEIILYNWNEVFQGSTYGQNKYFVIKATNGGVVDQHHFDGNNASTQ